jgi:hypothetical protein
MPPWRRVLALLAAIVIVALRMEPQLVQLAFVDRRPISDYFRRRPDRLWPQFPRFLEGVRANTRDGDAVAIIVPTLEWDSGYSYAYYRASYLLAGREVLPIADSNGGRHPGNLRRARYLAVWGRPAAPGATVVWRGEGGVLLRR